MLMFMKCKCNYASITPGVLQLCLTIYIKEQHILSNDEDCVTDCMKKYETINLAGKRGIIKKIKIHVSGSMLVRII